ncbi:MAG: hypothetical protein JXR68_08415 [Bacteroidales bacterium]|nr:hypothetical protein [Bacteroidales bacterium]
MKKINYLLGLVAVFGLSLLFSSCGEQDPIEYNDEVLGYYTELDEQIAQFETALWDGDYSIEDLQTEYDKTLSIYNANYDLVKAIAPLKKDPGFHAAVVAFYDGIKVALDNEYKQILDLYNSDDWQDDFIDKIYDLDDIVLEKLIELENKVTDSQQEFADAYNITLM